MEEGKINNGGGGRQKLFVLFVQVESDINIATTTSINKLDVRVWQLNDRRSVLVPTAEEASIYFRLPSNCIWFKGGCISEDKEEEEAEPPGDCVLSLFAAGILKKATFTYLYLINECCGPNWPGSSSQ